MIIDFVKVVPNPTIQDVYMDTMYLASLVKRSYDPDHIVGVSRGGLIPAVIFSHMMNTPLVPVVYSSAEGNGDDKAQTSLKNLPKFKKGDKILIVDDICDSGNTLKALVEFYRSKEVIVETAVLYYKDKWPTLNITDVKHGFYPNYFIKRVGIDDPWMIFPFEDFKSSLLQMKVQD